ncbi:oxaloacetate decarboxylase [Mycolicibacterium sp. 018/SC-01/001]|uniref:isocitrate lyase/PEP mutase family protein n=1 Tax=Mycolicibacterium sp. 018/SC-01/001 TaxID=2592069 RepID=UPI00163DBE33|nr:isocitrate lyase/PEP mutase family protein [Mycolicibacterium sp. 018/SC-01/001]
MAQQISPGRRLRDALAHTSATGPLIAPGAFDALSAGLVQQAGFAAVYMTGFGAAASLLGEPDVGLLSAAEMADQTRRICDATTLPVIADADTGFGNALNVARTVRFYERAGAAAIQLEDQVSPKRCGHMTGKSVISRQEMTGKITAATEARTDADTVIVARTDAIATDGLDEALQRARAYHAAGADVLFVEAPTNRHDVERVAAELAPEVPLLFNWAEGGRTPALSYQEIADLGFALIIYPIGTLLAATRGVQNFLAGLRAAGTPSLAGLPSFDEFTGIVGLPDLEALARRYDTV